MNDIMTKLAKDKTLLISIYGVGDTSNEINFTYHNTVLEYIDIESNNVDIFQLDSYNAQKDIMSDLLMVFKNSIVDYIMLEIFRQIDCFIKRNKKIDNVLLINIDISNEFIK